MWKWLCDHKINVSLPPGNAGANQSTSKAFNKLKGNLLI